MRGIAFDLGRAASAWPSTNRPRAQPSWDAAVAKKSGRPARASPAGAGTQDALLRLLAARGQPRERERRAHQRQELAAALSSSTSGCSGTGGAGNRGRPEPGPSRRSSRAAARRGAGTADALDRWVKLEVLVVIGGRWSRRRWSVRRSRGRAALELELVRRRLPGDAVDLGLRAQALSGARWHSRHYSMSSYFLPEREGSSCRSARAGGQPDAVHVRAVVEVLTKSGRSRYLHRRAVPSR